MFEATRVFGSLHRLGPSRFDRLAFGVPVGGPFDEEAATLVRDLTGAERVLELAGSAELVSHRDATLVIHGDAHEVRIDGRLHRSSILRIAEGHPVEVRTARGGVRVWLAGTVDRLPERSLAPPATIDAHELRVMPGPHAEGRLDVLLERGWTVDPRSDRLGVRLEGDERLVHEEQITSRAMTVGAVQVPPGGAPILVGPDGPTLGGYPVAAIVISADRDRMAHLAPGAQVRFRRVELPEARLAAEERLARIARTGREVRVALNVLRS